MRLFLLVTLTMTAFAGNSLLNRAALAHGLIDPLPFALIRVLAGALVLAVLVRARPQVSARRLGSAAALSLYLVGFSLAYVALDAGIGALILFAVVQITMLTGARIAGEPLPPRRLFGAGLALAGLLALFLPGVEAVPGPGPAALMAAAAVGWGLYSLAGRRAGAPLRATAANFVLAVPMVALCTLPFGWGNPTGAGVALALLSGAATSGLGYALWYAVLPALGTGRAAVAQLSVPVIALAGGALLLGERLSLAAMLACVLVLSGVALASLGPLQGSRNSGGVR